MKILRTFALIGLALVVAGCARTATVHQMPQPQPQTLPTASGPMISGADMLPQSQPQQDSSPIQQARLTASDASYIDGAALSRLNTQARRAATDAQFYALQFGRPGAPRSWNAGGASGSVSVGPYVTVNNLDCREFSHRVTLEGETFTRAGTACRETDGAWNVADA